VPALAREVSRDRKFTRSSNALHIERVMSQDQRGKYTGVRFRPILRDVQFWVPVAVLLVGLLVLAWVH
jgi:hypothetical protein